jgi:membrane protease YdiL (CAAX protease family)
VDNPQPGDQLELELAPFPVPVPSPPAPLPRWLALLQTIVVSGIPTQFVVMVVLVGLAGMNIDPTNVSLEFFAALSFIDTALVVILIRVFLAGSREDPRPIFLGTRPWRREAVRGLLLVPVVFLAVSLIVLAVRAAVPWMHNVPRNPFENFMDSPLEAAAFLVVVVLAGGVREEIQRAFILHRFEQRLGGAGVGLVIFSAAFGLLHKEQGYDSAVGIGALGLLWGIIYLRRRSVVAPMVNHASFNAAQVLQGLLVTSMGW